MRELNDTAEGVADSFDVFLNDYSISIKDAIERATKAAVGEWLEKHTEEMIDRIVGVAATTRRIRTAPVRGDVL